ncbi:hypothetical protein [Mycobacterium sp. 1423905.2]|uniref:hypothetical protein n=1 Tax=Mycobacterium sp. 1423905.2 TaxID=1856859 RepID=UPI0007FE200E|nr:hypothetical protein [Mycobacterium sp. 1423905.2]OBJ53396.1 hypothetical protein A9W95_18210 [Mycobacterium sp. 1423905.2]
MLRRGISKVVVTLCTVVIVCTSCHSGATSKSGGTGSAKPSTGPTAAAPGALFEVAEPFSGNVSGSPVAQRSEAIIQALTTAGGWGNGNAFQIDFSIPVFYADGHTPRMQVVGADEYCFNGPDCDRVPARMPVPANAYIEGSKDLTCDPSGNTEGQGDCHLLVVERDEHKLYEIYQGSKKGDSIAAQGFFVWDLRKAYPATLRGDQCTSADAAGFPIAALLPTADEVAAGAVNHPLRFILPNSHMKEGVYVRPATHAGGPQNSDPNAPPYGVRFRLKADFDESKYSTSEKVIIKALKTYGMLLSDGGEIPLTFADDRTSTAKWSNLGISPASFSNIGVDQFEVVELGPDINLTYDCVRNP